MSIFEVLGLTWDRSMMPLSVPVHPLERVCFRFHKLEAGFIWDAAQLEGNPLTFPEVQTLLAGIPVEGRALADQQQVFDLGVGARHLLSLVRAGRFAVTLAICVELHGSVTRDRALPTGPAAGQSFRDAVAALAACPPFERALAFFLFGVSQGLFSEGNQRVSWLMMNGILMSHGIDAISVPASRGQEWREKRERFARSREATEMMAFLLECHPATASSTGISLCCGPTGLAWPHSPRP